MISSTVLSPGISQEGFARENRDQAGSREDSHHLPVLFAPGTLGREPPRAPPPSLLAVLNPYIITALVYERDVGLCLNEP